MEGRGARALDLRYIASFRDLDDDRQGRWTCGSIAQRGPELRIDNRPDGALQQLIIGIANRLDIDHRAGRVQFGREHQHLMGIDLPGKLAKLGQQFFEPLDRIGWQIIVPQFRPQGPVARHLVRIHGLPRCRWKKHSIR